MTVTPLPKGFIPYHSIDGSKAVVLPASDGKRVNVVWAHSGPLAAKIDKNGFVELGPRHVVSQAAWKGTVSLAPSSVAVNGKRPVVKATAAKKAPAKARTAPKTGEEENRPRGRPRKDRLTPGSYEVGVLNHAHETRTPVPQDVLDKMSPETRLIEEARNRRLSGEATPVRRGRPPKPKNESNITPISRGKKRPAKSSPAKPKRKLIRTARGRAL